MFYVLEAFDVKGAEHATGTWSYATTSTFATASEAALWLAPRMADAAREGRFHAYRLEPVPIRGAKA